MNPEKKYCYEYPRPALTVDAVIFTLEQGETPLLKVLLIQRLSEPFASKWALPGGFINIGEAAEIAVRRELEEETALQLSNLLQLKTYSDPSRDPREHVVTIAFLALVNLKDHSVQCGSDAAEAAWFSLDELPKLAFDHATIIADALAKLKTMTSNNAIGL